MVDIATVWLRFLALTWPKRHFPRTLVHVRIKASLTVENAHLLEPTTCKQPENWIASKQLEFFRVCQILTSIMTFLNLAVAHTYVKDFDRNI